MTDDLISRSDAIEALSQHSYENGHDYDMTVELIKEVPSVDAQSVTRCKDCRRWGTGFAGETDKIKECQFAGYMVGENGYCVYAEAKEDEQ